jgi:hypothetical protein
LELNVKICFAIVGYLVLSAGSGLRMPAMSMLLMESSKVERRGRNYMVAERVIPSIPPALSVLIGASLFAANSPRLLFYLGFSGLLISALILHLALHETLHEVEPRISAIPVQRKSSQFGLFFPLLTLAFVLDGMSARAVSWYIPIFLGLENVELYGVLISVSTLVIAFFGIISGLLVDRVGAKYSLAPSWVLLAITVVVFSQAESFLWILLTYSIWVALDTIDTAVPPVLISECYPKEQRATVSGLFRMVVQSSLFAGPLLAGMAVSLGSVGPFWLKSAMNGLAAVLIVAAFRFQVRSSGGKNVATKQD